MPETAAETVIKLQKTGKLFHITDKSRRENFASTTIKLLTGMQIRRPLWALRNINAEIRKGETLGIIGPNGAGKSTLLLLIAEILHPTEGFVEIKGKTNLFFQLSAGLQPRLTVMENFAYCAALLGMEEKTLRLRLPEIIAFSGLRDFLYARYAELSSGLAARVAFSVAIHSDMEIILVDEALSVGDVVFQAKCRAEFARLRSEGRTLVVVSHNLDMVRTMSDKILYLEAGQQVFFGPAAEAVELYLKRMGQQQAGTMPPVKQTAAVKPDERSARLGSETEPDKQPPRQDIPRATAVKYSGILKDYKTAIGNVLSCSPSDLIFISSAYIPAMVSRMLKNTNDGGEAVIQANATPIFFDAVLRAGLKPVVTDINPSTLSSTPEILRGALTPETSMVILSHHNGIPGPSCEFRRICAEAGAILLEDIQSGLGIIDGQVPAGTAGKAGFFTSFLSGIMETDPSNTILHLGAESPRMPDPIDSVYSHLPSPDLMQRNTSSLRKSAEYAEINCRRFKELASAFSGNNDWFYVPRMPSGCFSIPRNFITIL
ncbi:MAG: ATP-binding cassette domain-containing protein, partial [bacterium]